MVQTSILPTEQINIASGIARRMRVMAMFHVSGVAREMKRYRAYMLAVFFSNSLETHLADAPTCRHLAQRKRHALARLCSQLDVPSKQARSSLPSSSIALASWCKACVFHNRIDMFACVRHSPTDETNSAHECMHCFSELASSVHVSTGK